MSLISGFRSMVGSAQDFERFQEEKSQREAEKAARNSSQEEKPRKGFTKRNSSEGSTKRNPLMLPRTDDEFIGGNNGDDESYEGYQGTSQEPAVSPLMRRQRREPVITLSNASAQKEEAVPRWQSEAEAQDDQDDRQAIFHEESAELDESEYYDADESDEDDDGTTYIYSEDDSEDAVETDSADPILTEESPLYYGGGYDVDEAGTESTDESMFVDLRQDDESYGEESMTMGDSGSGDGEDAVEYHEDSYSEYSGDEPEAEGHLNEGLEHNEPESSDDSYVDAEDEDDEDEPSITLNNTYQNMDELKRNAPKSAANQEDSRLPSSNEDPLNKKALLHSELHDGYIVLFDCGGTWQSLRQLMEDGYAFSDIQTFPMVVCKCTIDSRLVIAPEEVCQAIRAIFWNDVDAYEGILDGKSLSELHRRYKAGGQIESVSPDAANYVDDRARIGVVTETNQQSRLRTPQRGSRNVQQGQPIQPRNNPQQNVQKPAPTQQQATQPAQQQAKVQQENTPAQQKPAQPQQPKNSQQGVVNGKLQGARPSNPKQADSPRQGNSPQQNAQKQSPAAQQSQRRDNAPQHPAQPKPQQAKKAQQENTPAQQKPQQGNTQPQPVRQPNPAPVTSNPPTYTRGRRNGRLR